jgi:protein phosphatase
MTAPAAVSWAFAGLSDVGRTRSRNEDSFEIDWDIGLAVVCDGMGGHAGGDIASRTAAGAIVDFTASRAGSLPTAGKAGAEPAAATIRAAVAEANRSLFALNRQRGHADGRGMGTTAVGLWRVGGSDDVVIFHVGDSRLYRLRGHGLHQLTRDHSLYQAWLDNGGHGQAPHRNIITRALGTLPEVDCELTIHGVAAGDLFLICSDGLTSMASDAEIADTLIHGDSDLQATCGRLIALANRKGGHDNTTVVLARVGS